MSLLSPRIRHRGQELDADTLLAERQTELALPAFGAAASQHGPEPRRFYIPVLYGTPNDKPSHGHGLLAAGKIPSAIISHLPGCPNKARAQGSTNPPFPGVAWACFPQSLLCFLFLSHNTGKKGAGTRIPGGKEAIVLKTKELFLTCTSNNRKCPRAFTSSWTGLPDVFQDACLVWCSQKWQTTYSLSSILKECCSYSGAGKQSWCSRFLPNR